MKPEKIFDYIKNTLPDESDDFYSGVLLALEALRLPVRIAHKLSRSHIPRLTRAEVIRRQKERAKEHHKRTYVKRARHVHTLVCQHCHKEFQSKNKTARYCRVGHSPNSIERKRLMKRSFNAKSKPKWVPWTGISKIYLNKPEGMHVDHIIPLNHPEVCGLHVPWNLQYLSAEDNVRKSNHWDGTYENESWKNK